MAGFLQSRTSPFSLPTGGPPPLAKILGTVYRDANQNKQLDAGEVGIAGFTVFLDKNGNGKLDKGETSQKTASSGAFEFDVSAGTYLVLVVQRAGFTPTFPPVGTSYTVTTGNGQVTTGANFGFR